MKWALKRILRPAPITPIICTRIICIWGMGTGWLLFSTLLNSPGLLLLTAQRNSAPPQPIATVRTIGLALPGILYQYNGSPSNVLSSINNNGNNPFELQDVEAALEEWGIYSRLDLLRQLNQLMNGGSNEQYLYLRQLYYKYQAVFQAVPDSYQYEINSLYQIDSTALRNTIRNIWSIYHDLSYNDTRRLVFLWKMDNWLDIRPESIEGWDQARIVALVRWGYDMGYLKEQEAWPYIERAGAWVVENFADWNRFVENYIYGRLFEYAGTIQASQIFRDSALIWWELISPVNQGTALGSQEQTTGAWRNIRLQAYSNPKNSFYLQLYQNLYYFQQAIRNNNSSGIQNILDQRDTIITPELAQSQAVIEVAGYKVLQQPLDQPSARGLYPVLLAAMYSDRIMNILVSRGFRYEVTDRTGRTALHWGARNGNVSSISLALQLGLNPIQPDNEGKTAIHLAARHNTSLAMYRLLQAPRSKQLYPDSQGYTPLHEACYNRKDSNTFGILLQERYNQLPVDSRAGELQQTPLMLASSMGNAEQIVSLLQRGADPNARDAQGWTPLHYAAKIGSSSAIRLLLSDSSDINARSKTQETPLLIAVREADSQAVALLLQGGANVGYADLQLKQPIHLAGLNPDVNVLQLILQNGADPNALGPNAQTPMHFAAELGDPSHLQVLLEANAQTDSSSRFGFTPLMIAVSNRNYEAANYLINNGANINHNISSSTALPQDTGDLSPAVSLQEEPSPSSAQQEQPSSKIPQLEIPSLTELEQVQPSQEVNQESQTSTATDYFGWSPITLAARQGDYQVVWNLVEAGADFQNSNIRGWYPIHLAAAVGTTEVLSYLISRGANINRLNMEGQSPIALAATDLQNGAEKLRILLRAGANPQQVDSKGWSPMTYAALLGNREVIRQLLNQKANPNNPDVSLPPLIAAAYSGQQDIIFLLLQRGADPNLLYKDQGTTALHYAVALNRPEIWGNITARNIPEQLLQAGAVVNIADNTGNTPLFWAARWGNGTIVKLLLEHNANTFQENQQQLRPFHYALENSYAPARYLIDSFPLSQINQLDNTGMSVLLRAARFGTHRTVALLLASGANVNIIDSNNNNALTYALFSNDPENISTLIRGGLKINQNINIQETDQKNPPNPLIYAVREKAPINNIASLLNWLKAEYINSRNQEEKTALHYAIEQNSLPLIELLLRKGADSNIANSDNDTPLIMAVKSQEFTIVRLLLEAGANVRKPGNNFQTPLQVAISLGNTEITELLRNYGAKGNDNFQEKFVPGSASASPNSTPATDIAPPPNVSPGAAPNQTNINTPTGNSPAP